MCILGTDNEQIQIGDLKINAGMFHFGDKSYSIIGEEK